MIYLLDTDTFILLLRGTSMSQAKTAREKSVKQSAAAILARCKEHGQRGDILGLSAISLAELEFGLCHGEGNEKRRQAAFQMVMAPFQGFAFDAVECVHHYGILRSHLQSKGKPIGPLDTLIAAHALALQAVLVTHNTREFKRVPGLVTEDWA